MAADSSTQTLHMVADSSTQTHAAETRVDSGMQTQYETFNMARDDEPMEAHEAELTERKI